MRTRRKNPSFYISLKNNLMLYFQVPYVGGNTRINIQHELTTCRSTLGFTHTNTYTEILKHTQHKTLNSTLIISNCKLARQILSERGTERIKYHIIKYYIIQNL